MENKEDEKVVYCAHCGCAGNEEDFEIVNDEFFCDENCANESGYIKCHDCGRYEKESDMYYFEGYSDYICQNCYEDNYFTCDNCGEVCENDEMYVRDNGCFFHNGILYRFR